MPPINLLIKPSSSLCNMRCKYCFYADVTKNREVDNYGMMSGETLETMVKMALCYADDHCGFVFQGGEPTLVGLDFYRRLIRLQENYNIKNVKISNSIQTNGYLIDDEWAKFFAENDFLVGLSLDGPKDIHDAFRLDAAGKGTHNRLMRSINILKKHNVEFNILCVVNNYVARHGRRVYQFFKKSGFNYIQFIPCIDPFDDSENHDYSLNSKLYGNFLKAIFDLYYHDMLSGNYTSIRIFDTYIEMLMGFPPKTCGMSGVCTCYFTVEGDGTVFPCDFYVIDRYKMGNIHLQGFEQMATSEAAKRFVKESYHVDDRCRACKWFFICRGGCRRDREPFINGKASINKYCQSYKSFFEYAFPKLQELAMLVSRSRQLSCRN